MNGPFVSYAQNFEDVRLWRAFADVAQGRYVDIGAQHAVQDSVSLAFYQRGWRGVHVEPTPTYADALRAARPDEVVVQAAVSTNPGPISFFEIVGTGLSTGVTQLADRHKESGWQNQEIWVPTVTLAAVLDLAGKDLIHWLKIDVEGMEADVLESWGDHPARPAALVIEATAPNSTVQTHQEWYDLVLRRGYRDVLFDGLSRYFIHEAHAERGTALALSPNVFDGFQITLSHFSTQSVNAERAQAVEAAVRQGEAEREAALGEVRGDLGARLSAAEHAFAEERAAHLAQQEQGCALAEEKALLERAIAAHEERAAALASETEAARRDLLAQLVQTGEEHGVAKAAAAQLQARVDALLEEHTQAVEQGRRDREDALARLATLDAQIAQIRSDGVAREQEWLRIDHERLGALQDRGSRIEALQARTDALLEERALALADHRREREDALARLAALDAQIAQTRSDGAAREQEWLRIDHERLGALQDRGSRIEALQARTEALLEERALALADHRREREGALARLAALDAQIAQIRSDQAVREQEWSRIDQERCGALDERDRQIAALQSVHGDLKAALLTQEHQLEAALGLLRDPPDVLAGWPQQIAIRLARLAGRHPDEALGRQAAKIEAWIADCKAGADGTPEWTELSLADAGSTAEGSDHNKGITMAADHGAITTVPALLAPHDAEFIDAAFQAVLGRAPDPEGRAHYLARLRTGTHKLDILRQLRRSSEGRNFVPGVAGLDRAIKKHRRAQLPILGLIIRALFGDEGNSSSARQMRMMVNEIHRLNSGNSKSNSNSSQYESEVLKELKVIGDLIKNQTNLLLKIQNSKNANRANSQNNILRVEDILEMAK